MARASSIVLTLVIGGFLAIASACSSGADEVVVCKEDADCSPGQICREERCGAVGADGGLLPDGAPSCASENATCVVNDDCCSRLCTTTGRCGSISPPPPTGSSGSSGRPKCAGLYEVCTSVDCCTGFTCANGACR